MTTPAVVIFSGALLACVAALAVVILDVLGAF